MSFWQFNVGTPSYIFSLYRAWAANEFYSIEALCSYYHRIEFVGVRADVKQRGPKIFQTMRVIVLQGNPCKHPGFFSIKKHCSFKIFFVLIMFCFDYFISKIIQFFLRIVFFGYFPPISTTVRTVPPTLPRSWLSSHLPVMGMDADDTGTADGSPLVPAHCQTTPLRFNCTITPPNLVTPPTFTTTVMLCIQWIFTIRQPESRWDAKISYQFI